ncbi:LiaF transmembrane domain-containing protein [Roseivirga sp.]|uniref:LiaF transmembrane domain-containing protein n=1 Tax=Roseivirga sp. TaxID=1964215 RepID=UPI003B8AA62C
MNKINKNSLLGIILVAIGASIAAKNLGLLPWEVRHFLFQWENILMLLGVFFFFTQEDKKAGIILFVLGFFFVLDDWFRVNLSIWDFWPIAFIFIGVYILNRKPVTADDLNQNHLDEKDTIQDTAIFSGGDKVVNSDNFKGGSLTAVFGGSNIDLTMSKLSTESRQLDLFYMFGGSKIRVPTDWNVEVKATSIFGALTDKRVVKAYNPEKPETLIITGVIIFGGAELTN